MTENLTGEQQPKKKKMSGCLLAFLIFLGVVIIVAGIAGYFAYRGYQTVKQAIETGDIGQALGSLKDGILAEYSDYNMHTGDNLTTPPRVGDNLYLAQNVTIDGRNDGNVAIAAQVAKIQADITGNLAGTTQSMIIEDNASIGGDVKFVGQSVIIKGYVAGRISGTAQSLTIREDLIEKVDMQYESMTKLGAPRQIESETTTEETIEDAEEEAEEEPSHSKG